MADKGVRRLSLRFEGEVQGVGFRWTTRRLANEIGLTGWVKNEWDGSVSAEMQGTDEQIALFFGTLGGAWKYDPISYVIAEKEEIPPRDDEAAFRVTF